MPLLEGLFNTGNDNNAVNSSSSSLFCISLPGTRHLHRFQITSNGEKEANAEEVKEARISETVTFEQSQSFRHFHRSTKAF
uniref:Uncharacterized protein n=1 Tax=Nelumbo nucifera TaxID=4432 RepID=A0A822Y6W4_NELNU|nr:TPA_asm: hypothetical protein HUJ06_028374 [Nelumbo nucifera]